MFDNTSGRDAAAAVFKSIYRGLFASQEDRHKDGEPRETFNNFYVDSHRERFELPPKPER